MMPGDLQAALDRLAQAGDQLVPSAAANVRLWLTDERYREYQPALVEHLQRRDWATLNDVFWRAIPFGTAGRRGRMYPIGSAAINDRTIGETAQGLADYVRSRPEKLPLRCAVAYDTRHNSRHFAELCCEIMAAAGFEVFWFDAHRSTPELAFAVRRLGCCCGIMISASHNPPADNAIKVFWSHGGQLQPPHDQGVMQAVAAATEIDRLPLAEARRRGMLIDVRERIDPEFQDAVLSLASPGPRDVRLLYSPLHGTGLTSVLPVLERAGFKQLEVHGPQAEPDGDFPNVPRGVANPEDPAVFAQLIERGRQAGADLVLASDPDADRIGIACPEVPGGEWRVFSGNQIAVLLAEFILSRRRAAGTLRPDDFLVTTLVTTPMLARLAEYYGVRIFDNVLTGFKWLGGVIDEQGPERFLFAAEEAHGYLVGDYIRDKDAAGAAMLLAEQDAEARQRGETLHQVLDRLYRLLGYHAEVTVSRTFPGAAGMAAMQAAIARLRDKPPGELGGQRVVRLRDYLRDVSIRPRRGGQPVGDEPCDLLIFELEQAGYRVAVRPSGTEPKLKFYFFARCEVNAAGATPSFREEVARQIAAIQADVFAAARMPT